MAAWVAPITWTNGAVTASQMNAEVRDHATWLKGALDVVTNSTTADSGTSTYLSITRATATTAFRSLVTGDSVNRFTIDAAGALSWGSGSGAVDATLERIAAATLQLSGTSPSLVVKSTGADPYLGLSFRESTGAARFLLDYGTSTTEDVRLGLYDGTAGAETYYELVRLVAAGSSSYVKVPANLRIDPGALLINRASSGDPALYMYASGDTQPRFYSDNNGALSWGPGGSTAVDTTLYRGGASILETADMIQSDVAGRAFYASAGYFHGERASTSSTLLVGTVTGDTGGNETFFVTANGAISWGPGGSTARDTTLYRNAANRLKTDDLVDATGMGIATFTKAGAISDSDWAVAPPVGTIAIDTTNFKVYIRTGSATWKSSAAFT